MTELDERTTVLLHASADDLAEAVATRLVSRIAELQEHHGSVAQLCLTGGRIATKAYQHLAEDGPRSRVDWSAVDLWWGDERFVAADSEDRNDAPALALWGDLGLDPARIHQMPADDGSQSLDDAAAAYAAELGDTRFDICLLGVGPDGHIASLFPEHPSSYAEGEVIAVRSSPKPPPERISLTTEVINRSREVWFIVSGDDKADAVAMALIGAGPVQVPAAGAHGTDRSLWLLDRDAASKLPRDLSQRGII